MYGDNVGELRDTLAGLLRTSLGAELRSLCEQLTPSEQVALGQQITAYRNAALLWGMQALREAQRADGPGLGEIIGLRSQLHHELKSSHRGLPTLEELVTKHDVAIGDQWRRAARAAALAEQDFTAGVDRKHLTPKQQRTVLQDAADVTRAVVVLDAHHEGFPGLERLRDANRLMAKAEVCATGASVGVGDLRVDLSGWQPPPQMGHLRPDSVAEIAGVTQAQHELLVQLQRFPNAISTRLVFDAQRIVSHRAAIAVHETHPGLAARWIARRDAYTAIIRDTRDLRGLVGAERAVAVQASTVASRAERLSDSSQIGPLQARRLDRLFTHIDSQLVEIIRHGVAHDLYVIRTKIPRLDTAAEGVVQPVRTVHSMMSPRTGENLISAVRRRLVPLSPTARIPARAASSRHDLREALRTSAPVTAEPTLGL